MSTEERKLNAEQQRAVDASGAPVLIVAGAGTGKTTVLTERYLRLINEGRTTQEILALTFTEKAAGEMEERVLAKLPIGAYETWISTFHGFCQRILERYGLEIGLPTRFRLLNETDAWLLLRDHIEELPLDHYRPLGNPTKFLNELLKHFSRAKDEGVTAARYLEFAEQVALDGDAEFVTGERARLKELAACYAFYQKLLHDEGALDFGDLILETLRLCHERPRILQMMQDQFYEVFVDEFQDTNWAQYELVKLLTQKHQRLTVVGDDDQAIYKFRGASLANILQFCDDFPQAVTVYLTKNYRSAQEILDASYRAIQHNNPHRLEGRLHEGLSKKLTTDRTKPGVVSARWYPSLEDEAEAVATDIRKAKERYPDMLWKDVAILSRSNEGARPFVNALERQGIPVRFASTSGLYAHPAILDATAFLALATGAYDSIDVWRAVSVFCFGFPVRDLALFQQFESRKRFGLLEAIREAAQPKSDVGLAMFAKERECAGRAQKFIQFVEQIQEHARRSSPTDVFQKVIEQTGYLAGVLSYPESEKRETIRALNGFAERLRRYEQLTHGPSLMGFLEELRAEIDSGDEGVLPADPEDGPDVVSVMTIHASKGLEFSLVFLVSLVNERFPTRERKETIPLPDGLIMEREREAHEHIEEERRLLYVAMTRAKDQLVMTGADSYGGTRKKKPSVFFEEIGVPMELFAGSGDDTKKLQSPVVVPSIADVRESFPLKRRFSFTQLAAFRKCPKQYEFAHVYKIPILGSWQKSYGQSIHLTFRMVLERHMERVKGIQASLFSLQPETPQSGFRVTMTEAMELFDASWIDEWYENRAQHDRMKTEGRAGVRRMMETWIAEPPTVAFLERPFQWMVGDDRSIKGAVDRIDAIPTGGYRILDYKTGEPKTSDDLETGDKEQLWIYQCAMEASGLDIRELQYVYVRDGSTASVPIKQGEARDAFVEVTRERMNDILGSDFPATPSPFLCKYCDFRKICPFRKL